MDLTKILKVGDSVYCTLSGNVKVIKVTESYILVEGNDYISSLDSNGQCFKDGECIIFPSKDNRDWDTWETKKSCSFKPFDKVLVRDDPDYDQDHWRCDFFSHIDNNCFVASGGEWSECIPYNEETQHLVGTNQDCPDKYKIW